MNDIDGIDGEHVEIVLDRCEEIAYKIRSAINTIPLDVRRARSVDPSGNNTNQYEIDVIADAILFKSCEGFKGCVISEERPIDREALKQNPLWLIVDPVDGSSNASKGLNYWSFSAALVYNSIVIGAVVVDQTTGNVYRASGLGGVTYRDVKTGVSTNLMDVTLTNPNPGTISDNLFNSLVYFNTHSGPPMHFRHLRSLGSSALGICDVARGALDLYVDDKDVLLNPWDMLAGEYIAKMAGAVVIRRDNQGILLATGLMVYRSPMLSEDLQKIFPEFFIK